MRVVDPKALDVPTLEFMLGYLREERGCYVDKYGDVGDDGKLIIHEEANAAWRETMDSLIEWTENTTKIVKEQQAGVANGWPFPNDCDLAD